MPVLPLSAILCRIRRCRQRHLQHCLEPRPRPFLAQSGGDLVQISIIGGNNFKCTLSLGLRSVWHRFFFFLHRRKHQHLDAPSPPSMSDTVTGDTSSDTTFSRRPSATMLKMVTPQDVVRSPGPDMSPRTRALPDYFAVGPLKSELASIQEQEAPSYQLDGSRAGRRESTISFQDELPTRRSSNGTDGGNSISLGRKLSVSSVSSRRPRYSASLHGLELQEHAARIRASSPPPERFVTLSPCLLFLLLGFFFSFPSSSSSFLRGSQVVAKWYASPLSPRRCPAMSRFHLRRSTPF